MDGEQAELLSTRFEDRGPEFGDEEYLGWRYRLRVAGQTFWLRRYEDTAQLVSFMGIGEPEDNIRGGVPYENQAFATACRWLAANLGATQFDVATSDPEYPNGTHAPVDLSRLGAQRPRFEPRLGANVGRLKGATASWDGTTAAIRCLADFEEVLAEVTESAASGRPRDVLLAVPGAGTLTIVVGGRRSFLQHVPATGEPPYRVSVGDQTEEGTFTFWADGEYPTEVAWRNTVAQGLARSAALHFLEEAQLEPAIKWEEM